MENRVSKDYIEEKAPAISADFLTGSTEVGLDRIRTRLLDLTNRNKLLNFRHSTASSLRVVDVPIDSVFQKLRDNEKLPFLPVPEPQYIGEAPLAKDHAEQIGWNTSFDLNEAHEEGNTKSLPVLHYQEKLDTICRKIATAAKTAIEESGTNMLYLVFGFLEWYESDDSNQAHLAPLVILPVTIERAGGRGRAVETVLEYSGEDLESNLSLVEKMRRDFGLEIPIVEDDDTPEAYFAKFADILKLKRHWAVRQQITLALLSFGKLLMFRDLDPRTWPAGQSIARHPLVRELFEGSKNPNITLAEEFSIDAQELKQDVPHLILDADSSQHSALVQALRGQNLVIEGPPGTGKSQTITNLIAAALARGKTVLFVSEKLAALEVVRRRLDDAGLGMFCLEVHSHKTKKGALLNDLAQRHQLRGSFKDPRDLDRHLSIVDEKKALLTQYASLINKTIEPFSATIFEILWARDRCVQAIAARRDRLGPLIVPTFAQYTRTQFTQTEQLLSVYAQHLKAILAACRSIDDHPWWWIAIPLDFAGEERIQGLLSSFVETIRNAEKCCQELEQLAGIILTRTSHGLEHAAHTLALLPNSGTALTGDLLVPCQVAENRRALAAFIENVESFRRGVERLSGYAAPEGSLLNTHTADGLALALNCLRQWGLERHCVAEVKAVLDETEVTARRLEEAHSSFMVLLNVMGCDAPVTLSSAGFLLETIRLVEEAPSAQLHLRRPSFEGDGAKALLQAARQQAASLKKEEAALSKEFDVAQSAAPAELLAYAAVLENASFLNRLFGRDYRGALAAYRRIALSGKKAQRAQMGRALRAVADYCQRCAQFKGNAGYRDLLGDHFQGIDSPWEDLDQIIVWYERILVTLPQHQAHAEPFRRMVFTARADRLKAIKASLTSTEEHRASLDEIVTRVAAFTRSVPSQHALAVSGSFDDILDRLHKITRDLADALSAAARAGIREDVPLRDVPNVLAAAGQCREAKAAADEAIVARALLGQAYRSVDTDIEPIRRTLQFAEAIASCGLPEKTVQWLLCRDCETHLADLRARLGNANKHAANLHQLAEDLTAVSGSQFWSDNASNLWSTMRVRAECALANVEELTQWDHFLRVQIKIKQAGLDRLTGLAESRALEPQELGPIFQFVFYDTLARSVFTEHSELSQVTGITQEQIRHHFAAADRESIRLYSERVAAVIDQRPVPYGNQSGPVRTWTELALIVNEINKQKRHIPIRQLMLRAPNALVALKPCFMMGPLSVAQYLAPGQVRFDLVVMDEASQLKPEDAIGAIARGGQIVVVGDPKQLPPTTFFQRVSLDGDEDNAGDDRAAVEEGESILDVASTLFQPVRRLRWHYRSRHHSLIAFSNSEFYQRNLIIFPSAYHDDPSLGVKHRFIPDGVFENSRNPREAAIIAEAVLEHMRQHPDESLGVVTLNFEQRELVEELLDRQLRDDPAAIAYQERMKGGQETLFVKNLENVQGDERDVVFISTTYGPDAHGNQFQRFGPINGPSGHRRLNVLFTRAKKRVVVFSSLDPERIHTTASTPWGVRALKQYLIFARTGVLEQPDDGGDQPANDFERSVGDAIKEMGYDVVPQIGVAGFFIDLGVKHPAKAGAFLLGIECDGASYHSSRSARDRDRLRQEILENLGWKIHRIWSTDWFKSRDSEIRRLLDRIKDLLGSDPTYCRTQEQASRIETLRQRLIALRDGEIQPAFPDCLVEKGLLQDGLLEVFLQKRPKTKEEWFGKIPQGLRTGVDSRQVGRFLDRILEIISDCDA